MQKRADFSKRFIKQYEKAPLKIQVAFDKRSNLLLKTKNSPQLRIHLLQGQYLGYKSINITGDWRALYREIREGKATICFFDFLGTHSQLYR